MQKKPSEAILKFFLAQCASPMLAACSQTRGGGGVETLLLKVLEGLEVHLALEVGPDAAGLGGGGEGAVEAADAGLGGQRRGKALVEQVSGYAQVCRRAKSYIGVRPSVPPDVQTPH